MRPTAPYRLSHFLTPLLLIPAGIAAGSLAELSDFFTSLFNVLPTLLLLLGGALCLVYNRQRQLFMLSCVYIAYFLLDTQVDYFQAHRVVMPEAALVFHLCCVLLPLLFGMYGIWQERMHLLQDLLARSAALIAVAGVATALARRFPQGLAELLSATYWPALHGQWMNLAQLSYFGFLMAFVALVAAYVRQPRRCTRRNWLACLACYGCCPRYSSCPMRSP